MDALNTPLIDLCCIFQAILPDWIYIRESDGREGCRREGGDMRGSGQLMGLNLTLWRTIQSQVTTTVRLWVRVFVCVLLNWFPLRWQLQSGWHQCLPHPAPFPLYPHRTHTGRHHQHWPCNTHMQCSLLALEKKMAAVGVMFWSGYAFKSPSLPPPSSVQ